MAAKRIGTLVVHLIGSAVIQTYALVYYIFGREIGTARKWLAIIAALLIIAIDYVICRQLIVPAGKAGGRLLHGWDLLLMALPCGLMTFTIGMDPGYGGLSVLRLPFSEGLVVFGTLFVELCLIVERILLIRASKAEPGPDT